MNQIVRFASLARDRAFDLLCEAYGGHVSLHLRVRELPMVRTVEALIKVERAFAIGVDPDEAWPMTVAGLLDLIEARAIGAAAQAIGERPEPCRIYDLCAYRAALADITRQLLPAHPGAGRDPGVQPTDPS